MTIRTGHPFENENYEIVFLLVREEVWGQIFMNLGPQMAKIRVRTTEKGLIFNTMGTPT